MKVVAVVPAWNEEKTIGEVLDGLLPCVDEVVVVDDGSTDRTSQIASSRGVVLVRHALNRGLGAAICTGINAALGRNADVILTFDADGQHCVEDIFAVLEPIRKSEADIVIGSRLLSPVGMPLVRRIANQFGNLATHVLFGARVTDSQSGFRAMTREAASRLDLRTDRMEISSEIIAEAFRNRLRLVEVPITNVYTTYSLSKGQGLVMGFKTLGRLFLRSLR